MLTCLMAANYPHSLRGSANYLRMLAEGYDDRLFKTLLIQLAEEFDGEATILEDVLLAEGTRDIPMS